MDSVCAQQPSCQSSSTAPHAARVAAIPGQAGYCLVQHGEGLDEFNFMISFVCGSELQSNGMLPKPEGIKIAKVAGFMAELLAQTF